MSEPNFPTLLYPNGGETIVDGEVVIQWLIPVPLDTDASIVSFELYYTEQYDPNNEPDWNQIAVVPETASQFVWQFGTGIRTTNCRVAICSRNNRGEKSRYSVSADNFAINRKKLTQPAVYSPTPGQSYDKTVQILTDDSAILGTYSSRSFYQFYYSSVSLGVPSTLIAQNVPVGSGPVVWNTVNLPPADDYVVQVYLADDTDNVSDSAFITINIAHEGFFIIDTVPPVASIVINNNATFTNQENVTVQIVSYDAATGVQSLSLSDVTASSVANYLSDITTSGNSAPPQSPTDVANYTLSTGDGIKTVSMLSQDFGGNRNFGVDQRTFKIDVEFDNGGSVADTVIDTVTGTVWAIGSNNLYTITAFPSLITTFTDTPTAVAFFSGFAYVATVTSTGLGVLSRWNGYSVETVNAFSISDSIINTMVVYASLLFMGMENGLVYTFDGLTLKQVANVQNPVKNLVSDGNVLYLTERNGSGVFVYTGSSFISTGVVNGQS